MSTLVERAKSAMRKPVEASPERAARVKAAADLREAITGVQMERERIAAIRGRASKLSATIARLETEDAEARKAKAVAMVSYAAGEVTEESVTAASARARDVGSRLSDSREMYEAIAGELMRAEADWPPSKQKTLDGSKERMERVFWAAVYAEIAATEAPAGVQEWIRRCWAVYRVAGYDGLQGMFGELFTKEFETLEMEAIRQDIEREFLSESARD